jgi:acetyl esterase
MRRISQVVLIWMLILSISAQAKENLSPDKTLTYKRIGDVELTLHVFLPEAHQPTDRRPAIVFFFGGGWMGGRQSQFYQQATSFAAHGCVAFSVDYRVIKKHNTTLFECVKDGKSAIRWVRQHAAELGVDPNRIIAAGGSAGGHVAACTGVVQGHEQQGEDTTIRSMPNAMILYNPVIDTTKQGYGRSKVGKDRETEISPCHHVRKGIPPTLIFHGTADTTVPYENVARFTKLMNEAGNRCTLVSFDKRGHGFFNGSSFRVKNSDDDFNTTMDESIEFLAELGFLEPLKSKKR